ncbi:TrkA C-terminal domain-containing protein [Actinomadura welshii]
MYAIAPSAISGAVAERATDTRIAFLIRFGTGVLPEPKTVIQAGDQVYVASIAGRAAEAVALAGLAAQ